MLFNYKDYLEELSTHENPVKRQIIERWRTISQAKCLEEEPFYDYLKGFEVRDIPYKVPEELQDDFDWQLLFQLVTGSFSSIYHLEYPDPDATDEINPDDQLPELNITVKSGDVTVTKKVSELWSFQILRLYEIYFEELINLHSLACEDKNEDNSILEERKIRLKIFNKWKTENSRRVNELQQKIIRQNILNL